MKKILILTVVKIAVLLGVFGVAKAQVGEWEMIDTGFDYILYDMAFPEGQSDTGFAVGSTLTYNGDGIIIQTTDGGDTWEQIGDDDLPGLEACFFTSLDTGYVGGWDGYFAKTTDGGETWTEIEIDPDIWFIIDMEFWDDNNGIVAAWGAVAYVTDDGGETWTEATGLSDVQDLAYASADVLFACGGDENIHKSEDGGLTWSEIYSGWFQYYFVGVEFLDEDFGVVGGEDGKVLITEDGGDTWTENPTTYFHLWHGFHIFNTDSIYVAGTPEAVYKTTDGGVTFVDDYPDSNYDAAFYKILFTADNNTGYVCGSQGTFMRKIAPETAPAGAVTPEEIMFPETLIGETSIDSITITNTGTALLSVSSITSDDAAFVPEMTSVDLAPGASEVVTITFEPSEEGLFAGLLTIETNDPVSPTFEVDLIGEGIVEQFPVGTVTPDMVVFPQTWVGETAEFTIEIGNDGNAPLVVTNIASDNAAFYTDLTSVEVQAGDAEDVVITFAPEDEAYFEGTLTIECNDPVTPVFEVTLQGEGLIQQAVISVVDEMVFDTTDVYTTTNMILEVWNIGNASLDVTDIISSSSVFVVDITALTVEPGMSGEVTVSFSPMEEGMFEESLEIHSNDAASPTVVQMMGYGNLGTGIENKTAGNFEMEAYPNPFDLKVNVKVYQSDDQARPLYVYNMLGGLVKEIMPLEKGNGLLEYTWNGTNLNGENAPSGIYFGVLKTAETERSIKLIKR